MINNNERTLIVNYLNILNLPQDKLVTIMEIRKSYRELSKIYHPDVCIDAYKDGKKFMQIKEAYDFLTNNIAKVNECILLLIKLNENPEILEEIKIEEVKKTAEEKHIDVVRSSLIEKFEAYINSLNIMYYSKSSIELIQKLEQEFINKMYSDNLITVNDFNRAYDRYLEKVHNIKKIKVKKKIEIKHPMLSMVVTLILIACILICAIALIDYITSIIKNKG